MRARSFVPFLALLACASERPDSVGRTSAPIFGGRPSGDDENANVYIEAKNEDGDVLRCSGRIVAPRLVLTARHCVLKRRASAVQCAPDGSPIDVSADLTPEPPENVTVYFGSEKPGLRPVSVRQVLTLREVTICRSDIAFLVLSESPSDERIPIRRAPVERGNRISVAGWGYTSDDRTALPNRRTALDGLVVNEVGPGQIPSGTFAVAGNSVCIGDSGAAALIDGALAGTYSRIDGDAGNCSIEFTRNVFTEVSAQETLLLRAYEAIGETPWYAGERPPWLAAPGAACTRDDECRSNVCAATTATCAEPCGDTGLACAAGQTCSAGQCITPEAGANAEPSSNASSCAMHAAAPSPLAFALPLLALLRRCRRETSRATPIRA